ncbi:hypothetical protein C3747_124g43c [Trypanosoma cruzi]|uniref:CHCH domain-containing protein n=2 Tax=Trypanosoma cruzi TaxID=5693 RepID=Q4CTN1_TRYCC|nr:hypothetical protein, conserved [Trypanosoma cruzi]EAN83631.1 hypothetical protein, conserved [Trypanosoma cruzi]PWV05789.1 hypothetical protein C3747_124g43c [Trypanosoma cruzi]RNC50700.1 hypothetical protein TcCL_ESM12246 [Trypanosoma cruzi]|eukprot:XP_805482.1 hypothetical protein [Trypanosoma cruzi strain CL Brener]
MARTRRAPPSHSRTSAAPPPARPTSPPHNQQQHHTHQTASTPQQQPQVTNVYLQRGGGGTGILGTVASVAAGSVLGHGISNMLFNREQPPTQPAQAQEMAQRVGDGACAPQIKSYSKCLEVNAEHPENCKWAWDYFIQCQDEQQQGQ